MIRLKELRKYKQLNQQRLALELNVSQSSISKYEQGTSEPDIETILQLATYFGVTTDYFLGNSNDKFSFISPTLSDVENCVIYDIRRLNSDQKEKVRIYIKGLLQESV